MISLTEKPKITSERVYISVIAKMVKLTVDLIEGAGQYINPIRDRELDLRYCNTFPTSVTHLRFAGATKYQLLRTWERQWTSLIALISVTTKSGEINFLIQVDLLLCVPRKLDGFPYLQRVKCLLLNNNRIVRIGESLELNLPRLDTLMLTNNSIQVELPKQGSRSAR